ncbi:protein kinase [Vallitalea pronyensis]|uniref:non-specific serine/threonine protein kinase n=1 Tax=Vallitalea pronyensis TaxID=1348613 RepID=A0A8J8MGA7_9FIRM|nr:protein kinase [Vallitalea pronyensis]QUI21257.1 protein kinase [Vallitalea pronyensis]
MVGSTHFGKYRVLEEIGRGGMSRVFLAENVKLGNKWAIKRIEKKDSVINLLAEPSMLKDLNHALIPRIVDIEEDEDYLYIIEEYVEGVTLKEYRQQHSTIDEPTIIHFGKLLCQVLDYLHSRKPYPIIYRDMKPGNIMITENQSIKLVDFGIAREYKNHGDTDTVLIGTHGYAAPEQYNSAWQSDARTDIYSLGVTLYYMATNRNLSKPPYKILPLREFGLYSQGLERVISKCTNFNPDDRYQSIEELEQDLDALAQPKEDKKQTLYQGIKPQTIGVISLTPRAGSTFLSVNLASALAHRNILVSLIEFPYNEPYIYDLIGVSNYTTISYYPVLQEINNNNMIYRDEITVIDDIMYLIHDPTREPIDHWDDDKSTKLLYAAKDSLISIVDIGYHYSLIEPILHEFDLIFVMYHAMPPEIMANYRLFEKIMAYGRKRNNVRFILNNDNEGIHKKELHQYLGIKPDLSIPRLPEEWIYGSAYKKKVPYQLSKYRGTFDTLFDPIYKEIMPKELWKKKKRKRKLF